MKTKRAIFNMIMNIFSKIISVIFGVIIPRLYINHFGSEMNGLLSSIAGIFVYINLLESGVGEASIQALYAPISKGNQEKVNGILSATNVYYKHIGIYFSACVSFIAFLFPFLAKSQIAYNTIVIVIFLSAIPSALTYFFIGKYIVLLNADNRVYILTVLSMIFNTISNIIKIILIIFNSGVITIQISFSIINILQVIALFTYVKLKYPKLNLSVQPDTMAISQKNSVIFHQISSTIFNNIDVLLLTIFSGLKVVSVYTIYNMIFSQAGFLPSVFSNSLTASFGQLYFENKGRFKRLFDFFEVYYITLVFIVFIVAYVLIIPFLKIYTVEITDINYIDKWLPFLFLSVNLLSTARWPAVVVINIAGHYKQTQWRAFTEMMINLVVSILLVITIGIYGVLIGTIVALIYRTFDMIIYSSRYLLNRNSLIPIKRWVLNIIIGIIIILVYQGLKLEIHNYIQFAFVGFILFATISTIYLSIVTLMEKEARIVLFEYMNRISLSILKSVNRQKNNICE